jgi:diguanylate cyclase (GGDEF)-like protein
MEAFELSQGLSLPAFLQPLAGAYPFGISSTEGKRLDAVARYSANDANLEGSFDGIARLAAHLFDAPIGLCTLVKRDGIRAIGNFGLGNRRELPLEPGLCATAIAQHVPYVVESADSDARARAHSLVTGPENVRFFVAVQLRTRTGHNVGTLCVMDRMARHADAQALEFLTSLATLAVDRLEARCGVREIVPAHAAAESPGTEMDPLTGLPDRRALDEHLERVRDLALTQRPQGAVVAIEIEGLSLVNERRGRNIGDQLLRAVASALRGAFGDEERIFRTGPSEFAVMTESWPHDPGRHKGRVDSAMHTVRLVGFHEAYASVGFARLDEAETPRASYRLADWRMYAEKIDRR